MLIYLLYVLWEKYYYSAEKKKNNLIIGIIINKKREKEKKKKEKKKKKKKVGLLFNVLVRVIPNVVFVQCPMHAQTSAFSVIAFATGVVGGHNLA